MAVDVDVTVRLAGLNKMLKSLQHPAQSPEIREMLGKWAVVYRTFLTERFVRYSQGGGGWPALKYREPIPGILWDTGALLGALSPTDLTAPGGIAEITPDGTGVKVGFGGPAVHPTAERYGRMTTIAEIAGFHQVGAGNLPIRDAMADPDAQTINDMAVMMRDTLKQIREST
jgi:hypothetical protein